VLGASSLIWQPIAGEDGISTITGMESAWIFSESLLAGKCIGSLEDGARSREFRECRGY
jgi:hypothetical protein